MAKGGKQKQAKGKKKKKGSRLQTIILGFFGTLILIYFINFAALLVLLGLLPSFVAGYIDRSPDLAKAKVVTACNLAGIVPFVADLLRQGITSSNVHSVLLSGYTWVVMLSAAGLGWVLVWGFPKGAHAVLEYMNKNNVAGLRKRQQQIVDEWGLEVEMTASRALKNSAYKDEKANGSGADKESASKTLQIAGQKGKK